MPEIDWSHFSKQELVEILEAMTESVWLVERLDTDDLSCGVKDCSCDLASEPLPSRVTEILDKSNRRRKSRNPLARLLRRRNERESVRKNTG